METHQAEVTGEIIEERQRFEDCVELDEAATLIHNSKVGSK